jgi:uncharacterized protein (DUF58 family)
MVEVHLSPTRFCFIFLAILMAMGLAAINYDNNLVYFILFLLGSLALVSVVYTYRNLARVTIEVGNVWPVFAGGSLRFTLLISNRSQESVYSLRMGCPDLPEGGEPVNCETVPAGATKTLEMVMPVYRRGRHHLDEMLVTSLFPLGILRAFARAPMRMEYIVYPKPAGNRPWPDTETDYRTQDDGHLRGGDDFYGVRKYVAGESQRHIDWKAVARGRPLMVKEFLGGGTGRQWFSWTDVSGMADEARLSQLAQWMIEADEAGGKYGLRIPGVEISPSSGPRHYHRCLRALALFHPPRQSPS